MNGEPRGVQPSARSGGAERALFQTHLHDELLGIICPRTEFLDQGCQHFLSTSSHRLILGIFESLALFRFLGPANGIVHAFDAIQGEIQRELLFQRVLAIVKRVASFRRGRTRAGLRVGLVAVVAVMVVVGGDVRVGMRRGGRGAW